MTTLLIDFDGVINVESNPKAYKRAYRNDGGNPNMYTDVWSIGVDYKGQRQRVVYCKDLLSALHTLCLKHSSQWVWLTTWESESFNIDRRLLTRSNSYIKWDYADFDARNANKYAEFLKLVHTGETVVWIDDEATTLYNPNDLPPGAKVLVIKPNSVTGLTKSEVAAVDAFLTKNSATFEHKHDTV